MPPTIHRVYNQQRRKLITLLDQQLKDEELERVFDFDPTTLAGIELDRVARRMLIEWQLYCKWLDSVTFSPDAGPTPIIEAPVVREPMSGGEKIRAAKALTQGVKNY